MEIQASTPTVGFVGAGQLARMCQPPAIAMGVTLHLLSESPEDCAALVTPNVRVGNYSSIDDLRAFATWCDVVTFDHEHVPNDVIQTLEAEGFDLQPGAAALQFAQDKAAMRRRLGEMSVPCPAWSDLEISADPATDLASFGDRVGWPLVLKASRHGYDGKGVWVVESLDDAAELLASGTPLLAEEMVDIARELAAVVARNPSGQIAAWPCVETVQRDGICVEVIAPAPGLGDDHATRARQVAGDIAETLGVTGVLAVELFETTDGRLLVNELAMRPHNSGHWTIEGAVTSQFEQHLRAVLDWPLGSTAPTAPVTVMANVLAGSGGSSGGDDLQDRIRAVFATWPNAKVHLYGKTWRPGRKVGHVTVQGHHLDTVRDTARAAAATLAHGIERSTT